MSIPLNGPAPLGYRIGNSDRPVGHAANDPEGFVVLNMSTGAVYTVTSGLWVAGGSFDANLLAAWYATTTSNAGPGKGYRIGTTDRPIGGATSAPNNFIVLNTTTNATFVASGGVWTSGGTFPPALLAAWLAA
jgi:hypothetical protein